MKKTTIYSTIILLSFLAACSDSPGKTEITIENSGTHAKEPVSATSVDTARKTTISVGSNGAAVTNKNTEVIVDKNGVNVGTKSVKVVIKK